MLFDIILEDWREVPAGVLDAGVPRVLVGASGPRPSAFGVGAPDSSSPPSLCSYMGAIGTHPILHGSVGEALADYDPGTPRFFGLKGFGQAPLAVFECDTRLSSSKFSDRNFYNIFE